jgi:hypothetical protein
VRQVDAALALVRDRLGLSPAFALLAPVAGTPPRYRLFLESDAPGATLAEAARIVEEHLATGHHYRYARELGQLGPLELQRVEEGWAAWERTHVAAGRRAGDVKPAHLDARHDWAAVFAPRGVAA